MSEIKKLFEQLREEAAVGAQDAIARGEVPPADIAREAAVYGVKAEGLAPPGWRNTGEEPAKEAEEEIER